MVKHEWSHDIQHPLNSQKPFSNSLLHYTIISSPWSQLLSMFHMRYTVCDRGENGKTQTPELDRWVVEQYIIQSVFFLSPHSNVCSSGQIRHRVNSNPHKEASDSKVVQKQTAHASFVTSVLQLVVFSWDSSMRRFNIHHLLTSNHKHFGCANRSSESFQLLHFTG